MIDLKLLEKAKKIRELARRGATEGERRAAQLALDAFLKKHEIDPRLLDARIVVRRRIPFPPPGGVVIIQGVNPGFSWNWGFSSVTGSPTTTTTTTGNGFWT